MFLFPRCRRLSGRRDPDPAGPMTLTQVAQLAVVANASVSLTVAVPALARTLAQLGAQLCRAVRRRP
jgi:hypothetical protein